MTSKTLYFQGTILNKHEIKTNYGRRGNSDKFVNNLMVDENTENSTNFFHFQCYDDNHLGSPLELFYLLREFYDP